MGFDSIFISKSHWQVCLSIRYICRRYLRAMVLLNPEPFYLLFGKHQSPRAKQINAVCKQLCWRRSLCLFYQACHKCQMSLGLTCRRARCVTYAFSGSLSACLSRASLAAVTGCLHRAAPRLPACGYLPMPQHRRGNTPGTHSFTTGVSSLKATGQLAAQLDTLCSGHSEGKGGEV